MGQMLTRPTDNTPESVFEETKENFDHLFEAVESGNVSQLKHFVNLRPEVKLEKIRKKGKSLLHTAVFHHQLDLIQYLLELGLNANVQDDFGDTPLLELIENKSKDKVCMADHNLRCLELQLTLLLKFKANINTRSTLNRTVLLKSIIHTRYSLFELLLKNGADPNIADEDGLLPLHVCATYSCLSLLKQVLASGADINACDNSGRTALYFSVLAGHQEIFNELIRHNCDVSKGSRFGFPLQLAIVSGHLEMVQTLLENGADVQVNIDEHRLYPYSKVSDYLNVALLVAHKQITIPGLSTASSAVIEKAKRSLQILYLIIQAVENSTRNLHKNLFLKTKFTPFEEENLQLLNKMISLILRKLSFIYKMGKNCKPVDGLPKLNADIETGSLQNICRMRVRKLMCGARYNVIYAVDKIDYPRVLKDAILLKDV